MPPTDRTDIGNNNRSIVDIIERCTSRDPGARFSNFQEIMDMNIFEYDNSNDDENHLAKFYKALSTSYRPGEFSFNDFYEKFRKYYLLNQDNENDTRVGLHTLEKKIRELLSDDNECINQELWKRFETLFGQIKFEDFKAFLINLGTKTWFIGNVTLYDAMSLCKQKKLPFIVRYSSTTETDFSITYSIRTKTRKRKRRFFHERIDAVKLQGLLKGDFEEIAKRRRKQKWDEIHQTLKEN